LNLVGFANTDQEISLQKPLMVLFFYYLKIIEAIGYESQLLN